MRIRLIQFRPNSGLNTDLGLLSFHSSTEKSADPVVLFHAYRILLLAGVSSWANLGREDVLALRSLVVNAGAYHSLEMPPYVINQASTVYAAFTKRAWVNYVAPGVDSPPELLELKESMNSDIARLLASEFLEADPSIAPESDAGQNRLYKQKLFGLAVIDSLVMEFECSRKASSMDIGAESHMECFTRFESEELGNLLVSVMSMLMAGAEFTQPLYLEVFGKALQLVTRILSWPFGQIWQIIGIQFVHSTISTPCRPPLHWRNFLITPEMDMLNFYSHLYPIVRANDAQLTHVVCEGLMQLASLQGEIFGNTEESRAEPRKAWISSFGTVVMNILCIEGLSNTEMRDVSTIVQRFFGCTPLSAMIDALGSDSTEQFLTAIITRTEETMTRMTKISTPGGAFTDGAGHFEDDEVEDTVIGEALDTWLTAWASWSTDVTISTSFPPLQSLMFRIFNSYVLGRLEIAKAELLKDSDWVETDAPKSKQDLSNPVISEQLANVTAIGRMSPRASCEFLRSTLANIVGSLRTYVEASELSEASQALLEELHWLLMITGHFLCMINLGDMTSIPLPINRLCNTLDEQGEANQVIQLVNGIFELVALESTAFEVSQSTGAFVWSPLVSETLAWFLAHWSSCYLLLSDSSLLTPAASIQAEYGQSSATAHAILDSLLRKIVFNLTNWTGETNVLVRTCQILQLISRLDTLHMNLLVSLSGWNDLYNAWTSNDPLMAQFPPKVQRRLVQALAHIVQADGVDDQLTYLNAMVAPIDQQLSECLHAPNFTASFQTPPVMLSLQVALERIRGLFKSTRGRTFKSVNTISIRYLPSLVDLILLYKDHHAMTLLILKCMADYAKFVLACTYEEEYSLDFNQALSTLLAQAGAAGLFKKRGGKTRFTQLGSKYGDEDAQQEQVNELLQMLYILCCAVSSEGESSARVSFEGLALVVAPNLTEELLTYPLLCKHYFQFVTSIFDNHAQHLRSMDDSLFEGILTAIQSGIHHVDEYIQMAALDAVAQISSYNWKMMHGKNIDVLDTKRAILGSWIDVLIRWVLFDDSFRANLIMAASLTWFSLLLSEQDAYNHTVQNIIGEIQDPTTQQRLGELFNALLTGIEPVWNRTTKADFHDNFKQFVNVSRGMLRRK